MPSRRLAARELAELFKLLAHPDRIRLIEELRAQEIDVNSLHERLGLPAARVSQHLAALRLHRIVEERRDGRHHFYRLAQPDLASWILNGLTFVEARLNGGVDPKSAVAEARRLWTADIRPNASQTGGDHA
jgi:DNA-binding transcriptional ArsR family regulator